MTNYDKAIAAVLNEEDARDTTVAQAATANQSSASTQPTNSRQLKPNFDYLRNLNVDNNVVMKGWPEEIIDISVAGLSIDGSHIKCDVYKTDRSLGIINMRKPYAIGAWKTHLGTAGHKYEIVYREEQEQSEALGDNIPNDGKQQQFSSASFFTVKGTGSTFARKVSKKKKYGRTDTEISIRKSMEVAEVAVDAAEVGDETEL